MHFKIKRVNKHARIPFRASEKAAGFDLFSVENKILKSQNRILVDTGIQIELPDEHFGQVSGRSGLAVNQGIVVGGGIIDNDYRGNIYVLLFNLSEIDFEIHIGQRIGQILCLPFTCPQIIETDSLSSTVRNTSGFGSTGLE